MEKCIKRNSKIKAIVCAIVMVVIISITGAYAANLSDMQNHWAKEYVEYLTNKGAINGYPDGTFRPEEKVTYAEAIKLIVASYNKGIENGQEHWAINYVDYARQTGIVPENMFRNSELDEPISRKEVIYMVYQSITEYAKKPILNNDRIEIDLPFIDLDVSVNKYGIDYYEPIRQSYYLGILTGDDEGLMNPEENITRAEMATILTRAYSESYRKYPSTRASAYLPSNASEYSTILAYMPNSFYEAGSDSYAKYMKNKCPINYITPYRYDEPATALNAARVTGEMIINDIINVSCEMVDKEWEQWKNTMLKTNEYTLEQLEQYIQYVKDNKIIVKGGAMLNPCTMGEFYIDKKNSKLGIKGMITFSIESNPNEVEYLTLPEYVDSKKGIVDVPDAQYVIMYIQENSIDDPEKTFYNLKYETKSVSYI